MAVDSEIRLNLDCRGINLHHYSFGRDEGIPLEALYEMYTHTYSGISKEERMDVLSDGEFLVWLQKYPNVLIAANAQANPSAFFLFSKAQEVSGSADRFIKLGPMGFSRGTGRLDKVKHLRTIYDVIHRREVAELDAVFCVMAPALPGPVSSMLTSFLGFVPNVDSKLHQALMTTFIEKHGVETFIDAEPSSERSIVYRELRNTRRPNLVKPYPLQVLIFRP